ncbi:hypothetical protein Nepgr_004001 [Nepenthes gracilis]|uniref:Uncharacterized protein n=1 Tax=Nepenthes gracilis TaxID=150966 RepID=A0AAD3S0L0_NEPGR|nr:hypothetical protein Nepgr_004001 [Nepenthes gracilis]
MPIHEHNQNHATGYASRIAGSLLLGFSIHRQRSKLETQWAQRRGMEHYEYSRTTITCNSKYASKLNWSRGQHPITKIHAGEATKKIHE